MKTKVLFLVAAVLSAILLCFVVNNKRLEPILEENLSALVQYEVFTPAPCYLKADTFGAGDPFGDYLCCPEVIDGDICTCYFYAFAYLTDERQCLAQQ